MDKKKLATIAVICAAVAVVCVFLPWATISMKIDIPGANTSANGTEGDFKGVIVLILGLVGGAAALLVMLEKTDVVPLKEELLLFVATGALGLAAILTLTDFFWEGFKTVEGLGGVSRGFGLLLSLAGMIAGTVFSLLAAMKAKAGS